MRTMLQVPTPSRLPRGAQLLSLAGVLVIAVLIPVYRLQQLPWSEAVLASVTFVAPCILLGWGVWHFLTRRPKARSPAWGIARHVLFAATFSVMWTLPLVALMSLLRNEINLNLLKGGVVWQLVWGVVIYAAIVLGAHARQRLREQELATTNAELQALRAQLDPHFLFNTLHSLTQLAREDPIATQDALLRFGELMRYVLKSGRETGSEVALEHEIEFVRNYLALEKLRLGERLRVVESIDPDALELAVPPLLLQPLVENAVRHGLAPRRDGGTVCFNATASDDRLMICVSDDGNGADAVQTAAAKGLGLQMVVRQLRAYFGSDAVFEIETRPHAGFTVRLTVPARIPTRAP